MCVCVCVYVCVCVCVCWLIKNAYWSGDLFSSWILPPDLTVGGVCGAWNADFASLKSAIQQCRDRECGCNNQ